MSLIYHLDQLEGKKNEEMEKLRKQFKFKLDNALETVDECIAQIQEMLDGDKDAWSNAENFIKYRVRESDEDGK